MANATSVRAAWSARYVAFRRLQEAIAVEDARRLRLASELGDVRRQAGISLSAVGVALGYSASMVQQFERGSRWSEGLAFAYYEWALATTRHPSWASRRAPAHNDDDGCPVGDPDCLSRADECHDACENLHRDLEFRRSVWAAIEAAS